jgi:malonate decarboxylase epsilon subunit
VGNLKIVFTFPGQGVQTPGMLQDVPFQEKKTAENMIGASLRDDEEAFRSTTWIQLALFIKEISAARRLLEHQIYPQFVAGHSIGTFAAAVIAGVVTFEDALKLVWHRARRMNEVFPEGYGMGIINGLTEAEVKKAVNLAHSEAYPVYLSNINAEQQIAVSGSWQGIEKVFHFVRQLGAGKLIRLKVPTPSHCPLMADISLELMDMVKQLKLQDAAIPYLANRNGRKLWDREKIAEDLAFNVAYPVRWNDMTTVCVESGAECFIEMPPGNVLSNLVKQAHPITRQISVGDIGLDGTKYLINKWRE